MNLLRTVRVRFDKPTQTKLAGFPVTSYWRLRLILISASLGMLLPAFAERSSGEPKILTPKAVLVHGGRDCVLPKEQAHRPDVSGVAWSQDGSLISGYGNSGTLVAVWAAHTCKIARVLNLKDNPYAWSSLEFLGHHHLLVTPSSVLPKPNKTSLTIWDLDKGSVVRELPAPPNSNGRPYNFSVSPDGKRIAMTVNKFGAPVTIYSLDAWNIAQEIQVENGELASAISFSSDGARLAIGLSSGRVIIYDFFPAEKRSAEINNYDRLNEVGIGALGFSYDGRYLAVGGQFANKIPASPKYPQIKIWSQRQLVREIPGVPIPVLSLSWSSAANVLAAAMGDNTVRIYSASDAGAVFKIENIGTISTARFGPDGRQLAIATSNGIRVLDVDLD